jgi:hypothetical protein
MQQRHFSEADISKAFQEILSNMWNPEFHYNIQNNPQQTPNLKSIHFTLSNLIALRPIFRDFRKADSEY